MTETSISSGAIPKRTPRRLRVQLTRWSQRVRLGNKLAIALAVLALISGTATFGVMTRTEAPFDPGGSTLQILLMVDVIIFLALAGIIARRLVVVWLEHRRGSAGSKLHARIVGFFSLVAVGPPILMAFFSALFLDLGIESWFSNKVRTTLENSLVVAESYTAEHLRVIQADIQAMAADLNRQALRVEQNARLINLMVEDQAAKRALSEAIVFRGDGTLLARSTLNVNLNPEIGIPALALEQMKSGELVTISEPDDDRVRALIRLENFFDGYLYVSRFVDTKVLEHVKAAQDAVADYQAIEGDRSAIQLRFNIVFLVVGLLVLMSAIWIGLSIATQMVEPISKLVEASGKVARGDLTARVPNLATSDEIGTLSRAFNRMTGELASQQKTLIKTNLKLDDRRRFTEAVLSGVSAGVVGLDQNGRVTLLNATAIDMLAGDGEHLEGRHIEDVLPESLHLFEEARSTAKESVSSQISVLRDGNSRTLSVRIAPERGDGRRSGFVMTFDDITDQLGDQRTAAWADVARRIAHEIKNPLTPIQLSAERLQRKYKKEITTDPAVFDKCTETIIRQVGDLRHMVDEFSSFARMPAPVFKMEDVVDLVRQVVFLQQVGSDDIIIEFNQPAQPIDIACDGRLISQALVNIIKNAIEALDARFEDGHDFKSGHIKVSIEQDEKQLSIVVDDDGKGLPEELIERLTEPYVTTRSKGTGLGLAIVRKIMEDHGGNFTIENSPVSYGARSILTFNMMALERNQLFLNNNLSTQEDV